MWQQPGLKGASSSNIKEKAAHPYTGDGGVTSTYSPFSSRGAYLCLSAFPSHPIERFTLFPTLHDPLLSLHITPKPPPKTGYPPAGSRSHAGAWIFGTLLLLVLAAVGAAFSYHLRFGALPAIPWITTGGGSYSSIPPSGARAGETQPAYQAASSTAATEAGTPPPRRG